MVKRGESRNVLMKPSELVVELEKLRNELKGTSDPTWVKLLAEVFGNRIKAFNLQLEYERARKDEGIDPIDFFETGGPLLNSTDAQNIRRAEAIQLEIIETLKKGTKG